MSVELLSLCRVPKIAIRDGWVGATAHIFLPFYDYGYWFASGAQCTFANGTAPQSQGMTMYGTTKPNTFVKAPGICSNSA